MKNLFSFISDIAQATAKLTGHDVFLERDSEGGFSRVSHSCGSREYSGLGLHVVISPLQVSPQP